MNKHYNQLLEFHKAFGHPVASSPTPLDKDERLFRHKLMKEEIDELVDADELVDQVDACIDTIYLALGTLTMLGVEPENCFNIVHQANMSKLGSDGKPIYREDGKIMKPDNWTPPEPLLKKEIERQKQQINN